MSLAKTCRDCDQDFPIEEFGSRTINGKQYPLSYCRLCRNERARQYHAPRRQEIGLRSYGMTVVEWEAIYARQNGLCAICNQPNQGDRRLNVDHCHASGNVRGLLCSNCNRGLGLFKDDPELLKAAMTYLLG